MNKEDLKNIKVAIFDFDDTLAIHKDKDYLEKRNSSEENFINFYKNAYLNPNNFYDEIEICEVDNNLKKLIDILRNNSVKLYCLSGMKFSFQLKAKENFVHKHYGDDIEFLMSKSQEMKVEGIKVIKAINNCNLNEILFVDELEENIDRFKKLGIYALLPSEVENLISNIQR